VERLVRDGRVLVDGFPVGNPRSLTRSRTFTSSSTRISRSMSAAAGGFTLASAVGAAACGIAAAGWHVLASLPSPVRGAGGAIEFFVHARKESA
jgi:hypothetical protein